MSQRSIVISFLFVMLACTAYASGDFSAWKYLKDVALPGLSGETYVNVSIDDAVYLGGVSSIRIIDQTGGEIPFQRTTLSGAAETSPISWRVHDISEENSGDTMFLLDLRAGVQPVEHNQISIPSSSENFKRMISVYASDSSLPVSSSQWRLLGDKESIFSVYDPKFGVATKRLSVSYPLSTAKYLKMVVHSGEGRFLLDHDAAIQGSFISKQNVTEVDDVYSAKIVENSQTHSTEITVDRGGDGIPMSNITLSSVGKQNFNRYAVVQVSSDGIQWARVTEGTIFSIHTELFNGENLSFSGNWASRYIRVIVQNNDDKPVAWSEQIITSRPNEAVIFRAAPSVKYLLYYGNPNAAPAQYDLSRIAQYLGANEVTKGGVLSPQRENPDYVAPQAKEPPFTERYPWVLNVVLVLLVLVIITILLRFALPIFRQRSQ